MDKSANTVSLLPQTGGPGTSLCVAPPAPWPVWYGWRHQELSVSSYITQTSLHYVYKAVVLEEGPASLLAWNKASLYSFKVFFPIHSILLVKCHFWHLVTSLGSWDCEEEWSCNGFHRLIWLAWRVTLSFNNFFGIPILKHYFTDKI